MEKNVKVAKELLKLAKNLVALDEEGDGSGFQVLHDMNTNKINNINVAEENGELLNASVKLDMYLMQHLNLDIIWDMVI